MKNLIVADDHVPSSVIADFYSEEAGCHLAKESTGCCFELINGNVTNKFRCDLCCQVKFGAHQDESHAARLIARCKGATMGREALEMLKAECKR